MDYDPLTYVEKCLRGEIKVDKANWNTSGNYLSVELGIILISKCLSLCRNTRSDCSFVVDQLGESWSASRPSDVVNLVGIDQ